uniref:Choline transporter-like protein n=1 Tax=Peronospora matthiolae TaxID=2874970 RepID=A0AAV1UM23_9STRA
MYPTGINLNTGTHTVRSSSPPANKMSTPSSRPSSTAIDDLQDETRESRTSPPAGPITIPLSPVQDSSNNSEDRDDDDLLQSSSTATLLSLTNSIRGERPLPSLHSPLVFRDVPFSVTFLLHLVVLLLLTDRLRSDQERRNDRSEVVGELLDDEVSRTLASEEVVVALHSLCLVNLLFALGWLLSFVFYSKRHFVQGSWVLNIVGLSALALFLLFLLDLSYALVWGILLFFDLVVELLVTHPVLGYVTCTTLAVYTVWASWVCTTIGYVQHELSLWSFSIMYLAFHFYWTSNVLKNILTVVASGTTMIWYYQNEPSDVLAATDSCESVADRDASRVETSDHAQQDLMIGNLDRKVVLHYARCALSSSFGSICIGSLLCSLGHLVWIALRWARRDESVLSRWLMLLRSERVEHFIRTYHKYSFVHIAGYNKPYYVAAHDSWELIEYYGVEAIVDDDLTSRILLFASNGWAGVMSTLTALALSNASTHATFCTLVSFTLCYTTISLASQVIAAVIKTLFVCFAENPERLSQLHPLIYHRFVRLTELKSFHDHRASAYCRP